MPRGFGLVSNVGYSVIVYVIDTKNILVFRNYNYISKVYSLNLELLIVSLVIFKINQKIKK
jgi:hypothetical protein